MKLSKHDKRMVAMSWLAEVLLNALSHIDYSNAPKHKDEYYDELMLNYNIAFQIIADINTDFANDIDVVFGEKYKNKLTDVTYVIGVLYQTLDASELLSYFKWIGNMEQVKERLEKYDNESDEKDENND
jgi:hypothetical protein